MPIMHMRRSVPNADRLRLVQISQNLLMCPRLLGWLMEPTGQEHGLILAKSMGVVIMQASFRFDFLSMGFAESV
jgi:hypothetical protein